MFWLWMDEIIMQVARTVACRPRLQILSRLARQREIAPTLLASDLRMSLPVLSAHLRRLSGAGLIQQRRSGSWSYGVARSPYGPQAFSGRMASWLFELLKQPQRSLPQCADPAAGKLSAAEAESRLHEIVFEAATAFTHLRRLFILRCLAESSARDGEELASGLKMSAAALSRHCSKLVRRGYVVATRSGFRQTYGLSRVSKTPIHGKFWEFVREEWKKGLQT
jgi:DNA-binding transcriptional ArsR family regulator